MRFPAAAITVPPSANAIPSAAEPPWRAASSSGRNNSATPATPRAAATSVRSVSGVPNTKCAPIGFMNTMVEKTTATSPEGTYRSAQ